MGTIDRRMTWCTCHWHTFVHCGIVAHARATAHHSIHSISSLATHQWRALTRVLIEILVVEMKAIAKVVHSHAEKLLEIIWANGQRWILALPHRRCIHG